MSLLPPLISTSFSFDSKLYIVMPFYEGDLLDLIGKLKDKHLSEKGARHVFIQLMR